MEDEHENTFVGFRTTQRNTTMKQRYLSLSTDELNIIRSMIGKISHCRRSIRSLCLLETITTSLAYASTMQNNNSPCNSKINHSLLLLLCLSLLQMQCNELEIQQIKRAYFDSFALFIDDFDPLSGVALPKKIEQSTQ